MKRIITDFDKTTQWVLPNLYLLTVPGQCVKIFAQSEQGFESLGANFLLGLRPVEMAPSGQLDIRFTIYDFRFAVSESQIRKS